MFIALLTLLSALSISGVAAYYSIIGLATIFPGAFIPVVLMGSVLEAGKLVCASWLYRNWKQTNVLLRSYLFFAVIVLSIVTSMGIFGFLSKAHLQNEFADGSVQQKIELINSQIKTEESIITRQQEIINRAFGKDTSTTVRLNQLNERLRQLDKEVEAYTSQGTGVFKGDNVKKGLAVKESQKEERAQIQNEIRSLTNKSTASTQDAENKIAQSQQKITDLISKRDPLVAEKLKLEAEIGPIKYIAALAVDFGWSDKVDANSAVRWVIIILIFVFDPLAVLMLVAANQSFIRKFPVREDPPREIIDLEKPDLDPPPAPTRPDTPATEDPAVTQWNSMITKMNELATREREANNKRLEDTVKQWQLKLDQFNEKVEKPKPKKVEIIPLKEEKENENLVSYNLGKVLSDVTKDKVVKVDFKVDQKAEPSISQQIEKEMDEERTRPNFTEVIEPESSITQPKKNKIGLIGQHIIDKKSKAVILPLPKDEFERTGMLNKLHQQHGKFQDISDEELKLERDASNVQKFLDDVGITEEDAKDHPPITRSRMGFFEDYIDDIKRGDTVAENLPPDIAKTCAVLLSDYKNPDVIEPATPNTAVQQTGLSTMTPEELKEQFAIEPEIEDRDITEEELDSLLEGTEVASDDEYDIVISGGKKIKVPKQKYEQNAEQNESSRWKKIKELDLPEPEKNVLDLPPLQSADNDEIIELADAIQPEIKLPKENIAKHKNKMLSDDQYREKIETRINNLITKLESGEIELKDLTPEDQKVIIELLNEK